VADPTKRILSLRAIALGLAGVVAINLLTPFNNYVVANTDLIGNHLPLGMLLVFVFVVLVINAPLTKWLPAWALSRRELGLAMAMTLVGCAVPSVGLMRYLPGHLAAFWHYSATEAETKQLMTRLDLPDWLFPTAVGDRDRESVSRDFFLAGGVTDRSVAGRLAAVPWAAWIAPAVSWGIFLVGLWGSVLCIAVIMRRQWVENERLPFPIASVCTSLIEPPERGRVLNDLLRSRGFWIAVGLVFFAHMLTGLHKYQPTYFPRFQLRWNLTSLFAEPPWVFTSPFFKQSAIYFTIIGITYFVRSNVTFSLWSMFLLLQGARMLVMSRGGEITPVMEQDHVLGATLAMGTIILFIARQHLRLVIREMFRGGGYQLIGWCFISCVAIAIGWLMAAGTTFAGAAVSIGLLLVTAVVIMRVIGETGMLYILIPMPVNRPWLILGQDLPGGVTTSPRSYFFSTFFQGAFAHDTRESLAGFAPNALRVADEDEPGVRQPAARWGLIACLVLALVVAFIVGGGSTLWAHYNYAQSLHTPPESPIGSWGSYSMPKNYPILGTQAYLSRPGGTPEGHSRVAHVAFGAGVTSTLALLRLRIDGWPFDPIGFLLMSTWGVAQIWVSLLVGWLLKTLLLRVGGAKMFYAARPVFIGLIIGETLAAGFWLIVSFIFALNGMEYHTIQLLPA
jgi:hypothetical protein